jgi:hypothetical protein
MPPSDPVLAYITATGIALNKTPISPHNSLYTLIE